MSVEDYVWYAAFDDPESCATVSRFLMDRGEYEGSEDNRLRCPDGKERASLAASYNAIMDMRYLTLPVSNKKISFRIMRQWGNGGKLEFWPPGTDGTDSKASKPKRKSKASKPGKISLPPEVIKGSEL